MSDPRKHHFLSVCYLKGFSLENSKDGRLHVFNLESNKRFASTPRNVGHKRDLYKLDVGEGDDAFFLERGISEAVEGPFAKVMGSIVSRGALPCTPHDWDALLRFIAFQVARVPSTLDAAGWLSSQFAKESLRRISQDSSKFAQIKKRASDAGDLFEGTLEDLCEEVRRLDAGDLKMIPSRNLQLHQMLGMMDDFLHMIASRPWRLLIAEDEAPDLICSDRPVITTAPETNPPRGRFETWLGRAHLTFPLTRRMWLISNSEFDAEGVHVCSSKTVAAANYRIALHADRFLYSPNPVFTYKAGNKKPQNSENLAHLLEYREKKGASVLLRQARS